MPIQETEFAIMQEDIKYIKESIKNMKEDIRKNSSDVILQDKKIDKLCNCVEVMQKDNKEFMDFMKQQQTKGNKNIEKFLWLVIGALISIGAFLIQKNM